MSLVCGYLANSLVLKSVEVVNTVVRLCWRSVRGSFTLNRPRLIDVYIVTGWRAVCYDFTLGSLVAVVSGFNDGNHLV